MLMHDEELRVLHVSAANDPGAWDTLGNAATVMARLGVGQVLIALDPPGPDAERYAALAMEVRPLRARATSISDRVKALRREVLALCAERVYAVHCHGARACLLGARALGGTDLEGRTVYSPHLAQASSPLAAALLRRAVQRQLDAMACAAVTASVVEAPALGALLKRAPEVLPVPVDDVYFQAERREAPQPRILAGGAGDEAVREVSRLSVLMNGREARVAFCWLGVADAAARAQLEAAAVQVLGLEEDMARAQALARALAFVHVSSGGPLPAEVAQAMAAGVPCLVSDTPYHRALVRHGETGFVCTSERDFLEKLVLLLRDRGERRYLGESARAEAGRRFTFAHFQRALLRAYGFATSPAPAAVPVLSKIQ